MNLITEFSLSERKVLSGVQLQENYKKRIWIINKGGLLLTPIRKELERGRDIKLNRDWVANNKKSIIGCCKGRWNTF